jgi:hypothetical protein
MTQPLNLKSFGAKFNGADDTVALSLALAVGREQRQPVLIPAGAVCGYADVLLVEGIELYGESGATLHSLNTDRAAVTLRGVKPALRNLRMTGVKPAARSQKDTSARVLVLDASEFIVNGVQIESGSSAGVLTRRSKNGNVDQNRISGTLADSIHITEKSSFIEIKSNTIELSGDDGIAVVSYRKDGGLCHNIMAHRNTISANVGGRCMSVVGGADVLYEFNEMRGNAKNAGLYLAQQGLTSYDTLALKNVTARRNTIVNCGNKAIGHFAVMLYCGTERNDGVTLQRNLIVQDGVRGGIRVYGDQTGIAIDSNVCHNAAPAELIVTPGVVVTPYSGGPVGVA